MVIKQDLTEGANSRQVWTDAGDVERGDWSEAEDHVVLMADKAALPQLINLIHKGLHICRNQGSVGPALGEDLDELLRAWQKMID